jgi:hypothetical protein
MSKRYRLEYPGRDPQVIVIRERVVSFDGVRFTAHLAKNLKTGVQSSTTSPVRSYQNVAPAPVDTRLSKG